MYIYQIAYLFKNKQTIWRSFGGIKMAKKIKILAVLVAIVSIFCSSIPVQAATVARIYKSDIEKLERLVYAEAGNQSLEAQKHVCACVLNRVLYSQEFPNSVDEVINQYSVNSDGKRVYQFSCVSNGTYENAVPTEQVKQAVAECLAEYTNNTSTIPKNMLFFRSGHYFGWSTVENYTSIGDMYFSLLK